MQPLVLSSVQVSVYVPALDAVTEEVGEFALPNVIPEGPVHVPVPIDATAASVFERVQVVSSIPALAAGRPIKGPPDTVIGQPFAIYNIE